MLLNWGVGVDSWGSLGLQVHPKGNQSWMFIGRTDAKAPILWPPDGKNWLIGKDPDAGKDWRREEKGMTEDEMVGWTWVWASSGRWWRTGKPGMLQSMGSKESDTTQQLSSSVQFIFRNEKKLTTWETQKSIKNNNLSPMGKINRTLGEKSKWYT